MLSIISDKLNFAKKEEILKNLKNLGIDLNLGAILQNGETSSLALEIIKKFPDNFQNKLEKLKGLGVDLNVGEISPDGFKKSLAGKVIFYFPTDFEHKLKKIGELGLNVLINEVSPNSKVTPISKELSLENGVKLTIKGVAYFATKQLSNSAIQINIADSEVLFKSANGKEYTKFDFDNLEKDITPLRALVESGLMEQYGFKIQDVLNPETLEKIRQNFVPFIREYYHQGRFELTCYDSKFSEEINIQLPDLCIMNTASFLLPKNVRVIPDVNQEFNIKSEELIPGINKNHNIIRSEISILYDKIEKKNVENLDSDALDEFNAIPKKERKRLKKQFIDHFLIETKGCELTFGGEQKTRALNIAKEDNYS